MTDFLVKRFVKNYENTQEATVRTRYGLLAGIVGICCNVLLFGSKLFIGLLLGSISVMADAFNNLSDAASSIVGFVGTKLAEKPADEDHPFGHGRIEYIAAFIVAFLVVEVGFSLFKTSVGKIFHPEEINFKPISLVVLGLSICVKLWLAVFNKTLGKRINSTVMAATAADSFGDVAATSATVCSIVIFALTGFNIDGIVGVAVSIVVMIAGINIAKETLAPLIGEAVDPVLYEEITDFVTSYDGIMGAHDLIVHNYGPSNSMASIHAEVPNNVDIETSHEIIDRIEHDAARRFGMFFVIHMDPRETSDAKTMEFYHMVSEILDGLDSRLSFHDFRIVDGKERINLIFDLVVPREYSNEMKKSLKKKVEETVAEKDGRCRCVITIECSFCGD